MDFGPNWAFLTMPRHGTDEKGLTWAIVVSLEGLKPLFFLG